MTSESPPLAPPPASEAQSSEIAIPRRTLLSYGLGSLATTAASEFCGAYLLLFYTELMGLEPVWVGYAFLIRMFADALIDPLIGSLSDRTRSQAGRRRPYFLWGSLPGLLCLCLVLFPPAGSTMTKFLWLTLFSTAMACCLSLTAIPHLAMSFEMSPSTRQRVRIVGYRNFVESLSSLLALLSGPLLLGLVGVNFAGHLLSRADCYRMAALLIALLGTVTALLAFRGTRHADLTPDPQSDSFFKTFRDALRNLPFRRLVVIYLLIVVANRVALAQLFLMLEHFQGKPEQETVPLLLSFYLGSILGVPLSVLAGNTVGRRRTLQIGTLLWPLSFVGLVIARWQDPILLAISFGMGISLSLILAMLGAMVPDVLDADRNLTGRRREGQYAGLINLLLQIALGIGYLIAGWTLQLIGFRGNSPPSESVILGLRLSTALFPVICGSAAAIIVRRK